MLKCDIKRGLAVLAITGICLFPSAALANDSADQASEMTKMVFVPEDSIGIHSLKLGMYGERVKDMQELLAEKGFLDAMLDGYFGAATEKAVRSFQEQAEIEIDGIVGQATLEALATYKPKKIQDAENAQSSDHTAVQGNVLKQGISGEYVSYLQGHLTNAGYLNGEIDGNFGTATKEAVQAFQRDHGLEQDGIVGEATLAALHNALPTISRSARQLRMTATAYSAFDEGNGQYTHRGTFLCKGIAAVDPAVIPLGTRLYISGYGYAIADDTGSAIRGERIDLAFNSNADALHFGVRSVDVYILD